VRTAHAIRGLDDRLRIAGIVFVGFDDWFDELRIGG
jgi:hypothetical protein